MQMIMVRIFSSLHVGCLPAYPRVAAILSTCDGVIPYTLKEWPFHFFQFLDVSMYEIIVLSDEFVIVYNLPRD